jgi:segregation and condensation protein A
LSYEIKISNFEGPFDLLLHLLKKNEMSIYDIRIYDITTQYLSYLDSLKEMDLEITSEFIVVASTLIEIKSKMLLPQDKKKDEESDEDPRQTLIEKLIEYKKFKLAANFLREKRIQAGLFYTKKPEVIEDKSPKNFNNDFFKDITMLDLYNLYISLIHKNASKMNTSNIIERKIPVDRFRVEDKMDELRVFLNKNERAKFSSIMTTCKSKIEVVVTFLAMLELIKLKAIKVIQPDNFTDIFIERIDTSEI